MKEYIEGVGEVEAPNGFKEKLLNFWYHYKWHSLVAIVLIFALLVCSLQFCKKEEYDIYIMYAGPYVIGKTTTDSGEAEIESVISSLKRVTKDFDSDGNISINFANYFYMNNDELAAAGNNINQSFLSSEQKALEGALELSGYYLCLISPVVYETYKGADGGMFMSLSEFSSYVPEDAFYAHNAIKLCKTDFSNLPGINALPEDTLICIKAPTVFAAKSKEHKEYISRAKETLINLLKTSVKPLE